MIPGIIYQVIEYTGTKLLLAKDQRLRADIVQMSLGV